MERVEKPGRKPFGCPAEPGGQLRARKDFQQRQFEGMDRCLRVGGSASARSVKLEAACSEDGA